MAIALFGGTFDPVHKGHLAIAQAALEDARFHLERVIFIPADIPPHKREQSITSYADRFAMLQLGLKDYPRFELSRMEDPVATKGEPNYSINTIRRFKRERGLSTADLYFIVGIDSFLQLDSWREPQAIMSECQLIVASRPGFKHQAEQKNPTISFPRVAFLDSVSVDVSSTQIRRAVASGEPLDKYVTPEVAAYILARGLYR